MKALVTWLILTAVAVVVVVGVVDAVRGSSSDPQAAQAADSAVEASTATTALPVHPATEPVVTTGPVASTESVDATVTDTVPAATESLPSCDTEQLRLAFTVWDGLAAVALRRVKGPPCHHGRAPIEVTVRDQSGKRVAVFGGGMVTTQPVDFSGGFEQLLELPQMSCDPDETFLVIAAVGPYVVRRTLAGAELPCNHG
jgi:hypothetical protein